MYNNFTGGTEGTGRFKKFKISSTLLNKMIDTNVYSDDCPVDADRLRLLNVSYYDFKGADKHDGEIIVLDVVADRVLEIFEKLYKNKFPIASIKLPNHFDNDDKKSMEANNSYGFSCRKITSRDKLSLHSYGLAIDLNPLQNPYIDSEYEIGKTSVKVMPAAGMEYLNRLNIRPGMVENSIEEDGRKTLIELFDENGFDVWGGSWNYPIDYHHFQMDREHAEKLISLSPEEGVKYFETFTKRPRGTLNTLNYEDKEES